MFRLASALAEIFPEARSRVVAILVCLVFAAGIGMWLTEYLDASPGTWLQRRISFSRSGSVIEIEPGIYHKRIQIRKSVTLTTKEHPRSVTLSSIVVDGKCQVTIRHIDTYGVHITGSADVLLENVSVSSSKLCLSISDQSDVTARRCRFSGSISNGTLVMDDAQFEAADCTWGRNLQAGIAVRGSASVELQDCHITANRMNGLVLEDCASVKLNRCRVSHTGGDVFAMSLRSLSQWGTGIWIQDDAQLVAYESKISDNARNGVRVTDTATLEMQSSIITQNGSRLAFSSRAGDPSSSEPITLSDYGLGVLMSGACTVWLNDCDISSNLRGGVALHTEDCIQEPRLPEASDSMSIRFSNTGNRIAAPGEFGANHEFDCCPESLCAETN